MAAPKPPFAARTRALLELATGNRTIAPRTAVATPQSKIGVPAGPIDRSQASVPDPVAKSGGGDIRASATTYFTKVGPAVELYSGDRRWARVTVTLETAGPVAVGFVTNLTPVTSGKGVLLDTDVPMVFDIAKGNKLYIAATAVNRVKLQIQPYPWMEQITGLILDLGKMIASALTGGQ